MLSAAKEKQRQQMVKWRQEHKIEVQQYNRKYYLMNKTKLILNVKNYYQIYKTEVLQYVKEYYQAHRIERLQYAKEYCQNHKLGKQQYDKKYRLTERGKLLRNKQRTKRRRMLGYNPLNSWFKNSHAHHINNIDVVYIPADIHSQFITPTTQEHRDLIMKYYGSVENMITISK